MRGTDELRFIAGGSLRGLGEGQVEDGSQNGPDDFLLFMRNVDTVEGGGQSLPAELRRIFLDRPSKRNNNSGWIVDRLQMQLLSERIIASLPQIVEDVEVRLCLRPVHYPLALEQQPLYIPRRYLTWVVEVERDDGRESRCVLIQRRPTITERLQQSTDRVQLLDWKVNID